MLYSLFIEEDFRLHYIILRALKILLLIIRRRGHSGTWKIVYNKHTSLFCDYLLDFILQGHPALKF